MKKRLVILCLLGDPTIPAVSEPNSGGFNADTAELVELLMHTEYPVNIITNTSPRRQAAVETMAGERITLHRISVPPQALQQQELLGPMFLEVLRQVCQIWEAFDSPPFLIHSLYWYSGYLAMHLSQKYGVPFLHSAVSLSAEKINAGRQPKFHAQRDWENRFLPMADQVLVISETEADLLHTEYGLPWERIRIVGRGVSPALLAPSHNEAGTVGEISCPAVSPHLTDTHWWNGGAFTYIGRIIADKGIVEIVKAWQNLYQNFEDNTPPLWLVGGTPKEIEAIRADLTRQFPKLKEQEQSLRICWWGYLNAGSMSTVLMKSLALVQHSRFEAGGRVILEAMSTKTPVIATPYGFAKDFIKDWENGFLVPFGDTALLETRMSHFVRQPLLSNALGNSAYQTFREMESGWAFEQTHLALYQSYLTTFPRSGVSSTVQPRNREQYFEKSLITSYPYTGIPIPELAQIVQKSFTKAPSTLASVSNPTGASFLWLADDQWYIKQLYSTMNKARLWNTSQLPEATLVQMRFQRTCLSACSQQVQPLLHTDSENYLLVTEKTPVVPNICIDQKPEVAAETLAAFSATLQPHECKDQWGNNSAFSAACSNTLKGYWQELYQAMRQYRPSIEFRDMHKCLSLAEHLADAPERVPPVFGVSYGKTAYGHCLYGKNTYLLLPCANVFWGELGWDAGHFLADWLLRQNEVPDLGLTVLIHKVAALWELTPEKMLNWIFLHLSIRTFISCVCHTKMTAQRATHWIDRLKMLRLDPS